MLRGGGGACGNGAQGEAGEKERANRDFTGWHELSGVQDASEIVLCVRVSFDTSRGCP